MNREKRNRTIAIFVTISAHAGVVALLLFMAFTTPLPLPGEAGVEVNLGMYNEGTGNIQPEKPARPAEVTPAPQQTVKDEVVKQDTEETPAIDEPKKVEQPQQTVNQRALFKPKNTDEPQKSEGITENPGDQGNPNGAVNNGSYEGQGGSGGGTSYSLGGRGAKHLPSPDNNFTEEGRIVVDIWVDRDGNVKRAEIGKGTIITNATMRTMSLNAARAAKFSPDSNAAELQKGTITYNFIIRQ